MPFIAITTWQWLVLWVYKAERKTKIIQFDWNNPWINPAFDAN